MSKEGQTEEEKKEERLKVSWILVRNNIVVFYNGVSWLLRKDKFENTYKEDWNREDLVSYIKRRVCKHLSIKKKQDELAREIEQLIYLEWKKNK